MIFGTRSSIVPTRVSQVGDGPSRYEDLRGEVPPLAGTLTFLAATSGVGSAHKASVYIDSRWYPADLPSIYFRFDAEFPGSSGSSARERILDANDSWDAIPDADIIFYWQSPDYSSFSGANPCAQPADKNGIHFENISDYGRTYLCVDTDANPDKIVNAQLVLDSDLPGTHTWYKGTGSVPSDELDMWSIATHEFGHFGGWGPHFTDSNRCPAEPYSAWETMCSSIDDLSTGDEYGKRFRRTLEDHDIDTYQAAY